MIGIIGAMEEEVTALKNEMSITEEKKIHQIQFYVGSIEQRKVVLMQGGIGKVNAAYATTIMMEHFAIDLLINIGSAGGLDLQENVGDVVVASSVIHHDFDCTAFGRAFGEIPDMPLAFEASSQHMEIVTKCLEDLELSYHVGLIVSGDQFIAQKQQVETIQKHFPKAIAAEMEAASVAQIAYLYRVPFVILRSLSDVFGKGNSDMQFDTYLTLASKNSALLTKKVIGALK